MTAPTVAFLVVVAVAAVVVLWRWWRARREAFDDLVVGITKVGRGVFAKRAFSKGEVVETCPVIVRPTEEWGTALSDYIFQHDDDNYALALGMCSLYNHSDTPNVVYTYDDQTTSMVATAKRAIRAGEELRISYGPTWFSDRGLKAE